VQLHEGQNLTAEALISACRGAMADYKVPRHVRFVSDFPRTSTGKIQRFVLAQQAREMLASIEPPVAGALNPEGAAS